MKSTRISICLAVLLVALGLPVSAQNVSLPLFDLGSPNKPGGSQGAREMMEHPDQWTQTRAVTNVFLISGGAIERYSDDDLRKWFAQLQQWNIQLEIETGAVKEWGKTGVGTFARAKTMLDRVQRLGGKVADIAMDEPLSCVRRLIKKPDQFAVDETASFIQLMQSTYPDIRIIEIEPYPSIPAADHATWMNNLQAKLASENLKPLLAYRLDVDWANHKTNWSEVKQIEDSCHAAKLPFSLIYWAAGYRPFAKTHPTDTAIWARFIMQMGDLYGAQGERPDQYVIESWIGEPHAIVPESDPNSFTGSALAFYHKFVKPSSASTP